MPATRRPSHSEVVVGLALNTIRGAMHEEEEDQRKKAAAAFAAAKMQEPGSTAETAANLSESYHRGRADALSAARRYLVQMDAVKLPQESQ